MNLENGSIIELDGMNCCVLDIQNIDNITHIYVVEMEDDDITENFYVYRMNSNNFFEKVVNSDELKVILPIFIQSMSKELNGGEF